MNGRTCYCSSIGNIHDAEFHTYVLDCQFTIDIGYGITCCHVLVVAVLDDGIAGYVIALADFSLTAGDGNRIDSIALCEVSICVGILGQLIAVIKLCGIAGSNGQRLLLDYKAGLRLTGFIVGISIHRGLYPVCARQVRYGRAIVTIFSIGISIGWPIATLVILDLWRFGIFAVGPAVNGDC